MLAEFYCVLLLQTVEVCVYVPTPCVYLFVSWMAYTRFLTRNSPVNKAEFLVPISIDMVKTNEITRSLIVK